MSAADARGAGAGAARPDLLILCYHAVSEDWPFAAAVRPRELERQLRSLLRRGFEARSLSAALEAPGAGPTLVVTFDDAFASVRRLALPLMARLGVPGTVFVPTDHATGGTPMTWSLLGQWSGTPHERELSPMSWDEIRDLRDSGWEIGSHTCSHPDLTRISEREAERELRRSREVCESEAERPCRALAYPFGRCDERVVELAGGSGYAAAVTLGGRLAEPLAPTGPLALGRVGVYRATSRPLFGAKTSVRLRRARAAPAYRKLMGRN
jgi:peptidoglycan/xylan/chitin deacetylase (PgdA/CDA1 family)